MKIAFAEPSLPKSGTLAVAVSEGGHLAATAAQLDERLGGALERAIAGSRFTGKKRQFLDLLVPGDIGLERLVLAGIGKPDELDARGAEDLGGALHGHLASSGVTSLTVAVDAIEGTRLGAPEVAAHIAFGMRLGAYRFDKYRTKEKPEDKPSLQGLTLNVENAAAAERAYSSLEKVAAGVELARNLIAEPPNVLYPESMAREVESLRSLGVEVELLNEKAMRDLGMGALLGVSQGSDREAYLAVMQWRGASDPSSAPLALIGKGVTFDTGGISIKPGGRHGGHEVRHGRCRRGDRR